MIDWSIEAVSFGNCNCDYFCPCQFERRPNQGHCRGFEVGRIDRGTPAVRSQTSERQLPAS